MNTRVEHIPQFRALILWIPAVMLVTEAEHALLGAALFFIAAGASDGSVKLPLVECLAQALRLHDIRVHLAAASKWVDASSQSLLIDVHAQVNAKALRGLVAETDHLPELPRGVHMQKREGRLGRPECLHGQLQQDRAVLTDGIHQHWSLETSGGFAQDLDALCLKLVKMGEFGGHWSGKV